MNNWTKISGEELQLGMSIASLKKGELQIKYVKDVSRLNNIIKEVREYIEENMFKDNNGCGCWWYGFDEYREAKKELLEILDKVDKEKK